jgi:hypothetical protein
MRLSSCFVIVAVVAACAGSTPTEYQRGTYTPPPPAPTFNPTRSAPHTVGQPGYVGPVEGLPRSPHGRVLPQTPETRKGPGIWAAKPASEEPPDRFVFGIGLPFIPDIPEEDERQQLVYRCARMIQDVIKRSAMVQEWTQLSFGEKFCIAAKAYDFCARQDQAWFHETEKPVTDYWKDAANRGAASAEDFEKKLCGPKDHSTEAARVFARRVLEQWNSALRKDTWKW